MSETYKKVVRGVAIYDIVATIGMALPGLSVLTMQLYLQLHQSMGMSGEFPTFSSLHHVFVNMTGILVFLWSFARIRLPDPFLTSCDVAARFVVATLLLYYVFAAGVSQLFLAFVASELIGAALEIWALKHR